MNAQTRAFKSALYKSLKRHHNASTSLVVLWWPVLLQVFVKLDLCRLLRSPVMLAVELTAVLTTLLYFVPDRAMPTLVALRTTPQLWFTMLFVGFAEVLAEGRGKARADSLKTDSQGLSTNKQRADGSFESVTASSLHKGDATRVQVGETTPDDGETIEGVAAVNEAAVTGESAPMIHESGDDRSAVTGNTQAMSGWLLVRIGASPGESTLDRMIVLVEGAKRQKTPNEVTLNILLIGLTLIFLLVAVTLKPFALFAGGSLPLASLVALLVILTPTTIGGLLSAVNIAGMDHLARLNVIVRPGRAVEAVGDVHVLLLDKTDTTTFGNRRYSALYATPGVSGEEPAEDMLLTLLADGTLEGKLIAEYLRILHPIEEPHREELMPIAFSVETRLSGVDWNGQIYREGAVGAALRLTNLLWGKIPGVLSREADKTTQNGGTPLLAVANDRLLDAIRLKDVIKPGIHERFAGLRRLGIRTVMVTGDSPLTAAVIATEAGIDDAITKATPEKKLTRIRQEQGEDRLVAMYGDDTNDTLILAQANIGMAMNDGTQATRGTTNLVNLDSDLTKLLDMVQMGEELLVIRDVLTTFSTVSDVVKYFVILSTLFVGIYPQLDVLNVMRLQSPQSATLSVIMLDTLITIALILPALRGVRVQAADAPQLLQRNLLIYDVDGLVAPFPGIRTIDLLLTAISLA